MIGHRNVAESIPFVNQEPAPCELHTLPLCASEYTLMIMPPFTLRAGFLPCVVLAAVGGHAAWNRWRWG